MKFVDDDDDDDDDTHSLTPLQIPSQSPLGIPGPVSRCCIGNTSFLIPGNTNRSGVDDGYNEQRCWEETASSAGQHVYRVGHENY